MSRGLNKVMLIGNLGRDPEMRHTPSGRPVTSFSVATNRSWQAADGERHEETEWFNIVAWGSLAEICQQHLSRSQQVHVEGRLQTPALTMPRDEALSTESWPEVIVLGSRDPGAQVHPHETYEEEPIS
jgi:single-strand DNA-binding protein